MIHSIENEFLKISVKEFGCELTSVCSKEDGFEYLWQGNPEVWSGQSPILFPIVGRLLEDKYYLDGKQYTLPKHGFAKRMPWKFLSSDNNSMKFILTENEETLPLFPFEFDLVVTFSLEGKILRVSHDVLNRNDKTMYFSLGAHPAFNCKLGDVLTFDLPETLEAVKIDYATALRLPDFTPVLNNERDIVVEKETFAEDALIFSGVASDNITLWSKNHDRTVKFNIGKAPFLGLWAKPGAEYVCIEPWCGLNDSMEKKKDFSEKDGINALLPGESFNFTWTAEFSR